MRIFYLALVALLLETLSLSIRADENITTFIKNANDHQIEKIREYRPFVEEAMQHEKSLSAPFKKDFIQALSTQGQAINSSQHKNNDSAVTQNGPTVIIFISFSMPEQSIIDYLRDAKRIHASVVIRGLINNSFKETFLKMASLLKRAGSGGVELNPSLYKKWMITQVPAVVVLADRPLGDASLQKQPDGFDVIYGDIPLRDALKMIRDHGTHSINNASESLAFFEVASHA